MVKEVDGKHYSIVIPAHNEGENLSKFVDAFMADMPAGLRNRPHEIIIVENGSTDDTHAECRKLESRYPGRVKTFSIGRGSYGEAIRKGILESRGKFLSILECDLLDPEFVDRSLRVFSSHRPKMIVASKRHPESLDERPLARRLLTAWFNAILKTFTGYPGSDSHGLKSMETDWARKICSISITTDEAFQTEIVVLTWRLGGKIVELPVRIGERRAAPVSVTKRFRKVVRILPELRCSIGRFPDGNDGEVLVLSGPWEKGPENE